MGENQEDIPFCFFWVNKGKGFNFIRLGIDSNMFPSVEQVTRHVLNHLDIQKKADIVSPASNQKLVCLENMSQLVDGKHFAVVLPGFTENKAIPKFMLNQEHYQSVVHMFSYWDFLLQQISKIKLKQNSPLELFSQDGSIVDESGNMLPNFSLVNSAFM